MDAVAAVARHAEEVGVDSLWFPEHVVFVQGAVSPYPYTVDGSMNFGRRPGVYDPLIALTVAATATERIRLGTGVLILPEHEPVALAQRVVALDHASAGRFDLGIGTGWLREEFEALGVPFEHRGARSDEYLDAMRAAWTGEAVEFKGRFVDWHGWSMQPPPVQRRVVDGQPAVPVVVGGTSPAALRRVVARGDGWYVIHKDLEQFAELMQAFRAECDRQGRDPATIEVTAYWNHHREGLEGAGVYEAAGVSRLLVNPDALRMGQPDEAVRRFADEVLSQLE
jgi:probable F420-dependent oxidoreductase